LDAVVDKNFVFNECLDQEFLGKSKGF